MSLHMHTNKVKFKGKVYFKQNVKGGKCDLYNKRGELVYVGIREELLC